MSFQNRKAWGEKLYPEVFSVFAQVIGRESSPSEDMGKGIDLVLPAAGISVRIRRPEYSKYSGDITIRLNPNEDGRTELDKLLSPPAAGLKVDYFFYGFAVDNECTALGHWTIYDMEIFAGTDVRHKEQMTRNGEKFAVFKVQDFPQEFILGGGFGDQITYRRASRRINGGAG
jgi:hypothetical protein